MATGRVNVGCAKKELKNTLTTKYTIVHSYSIGEITAMNMNNRYLITGNLVGKLRSYDISKEDEKPYYDIVTTNGKLERISSIAINENNFLCVGDTHGSYIIKQIDIDSSEVGDGLKSIPIKGIISSNRYEKETFIIVYQDGYVKCVSESNSVLWTKEIKETIYEVSRTQSKDLIVCTGQREVICLDKNNGAQKWKTTDLGENILAIDTYIDDGVIAFGSSKNIIKISKDGTYNKYSFNGDNFRKIFSKKNGYFFGITSSTASKFPILLFDNSFKQSNEFDIGFRDSRYENATSNNKGMMAVSWYVAPSNSRGVTVYYTDVYI